MATLVIVETPAHWPFDIPGVTVVSARDYLTDPEYSDLRRAKVFNLCRSYRYQSVGHYVSLLAEARGHRPRPSLTTVQDLRSRTLSRILTADLDDLVRRSLASIQSDEFTLSIYFGRNLARRHDRLSLQLFNLFEAPLLRAQFARVKGDWQMQAIRPVATREIPDSHRPAVLEFAREYFSKNRASPRPRKVPRYDLAILVNPEEAEPPSDERAIRKFTRAAEELGFKVQTVTRDDYARLGEFDALFIRETTAVNHHTYRFARRAEREGLAVIDDPLSILRCTNKVYLAELFDRSRIASPRTLILHKNNLERVPVELGLPCVLKRPDSSYSAGVVKVSDEEELARAAEAFFESSELLIAQEFLPTEFDWRVGVFEGEALYVCKYHMAPRHWQIIKHTSGRTTRYGKVEPVPLDEAPERVVRLAVRAARKIGNGLYGIDLKQVGSKAVVMEVNDNPSLDAGYEDKLLGDDLYLRIMAGLLRRVEERASGRLRS